MKELCELCNGLDPDTVTLDDHEKSLELKKIDEKIERAMHAEALHGIDYERRNRLIEPWLKIADYHFKPSDAIPWADGRFPKFPKRFLDLLPLSDPTKVMKNSMQETPEIKDPAPQSNVYDVFRALLEMQFNSNKIKGLKKGESSSIDNLRSELSIVGVEVCTKSLRAYLKKAYRK